MTVNNELERIRRGLKVTEENKENIRQEIRHSGRGSNSTPLDYKSKALAAKPICWVCGICTVFYLQGVTMMSRGKGKEFAQCLTCIHIAGFCGSNN
jgi:hypothetical protein